VRKLLLLLFLLMLPPSLSASVIVYEERRDQETTPTPLTPQLSVYQTRRPRGACQDACYMVLLRTTLPWITRSAPFPPVSS
jgi:hypothetical protein